MSVSDLERKQAIDKALRRFVTGCLAENALNLLLALGYQSNKMLKLYPNNYNNFIDNFDRDKQLDRQKALLNEWLSVDFLFQLTWDEVKQNIQLNLPLDTSTEVPESFVTSYLFFAIGLRGSTYTCEQLDGIVCEVNKLFPMPVMLLFRHGITLTLSIINRRRDKRNEWKDVVDKIKHVKDISFTSPISAHIKILFELSLAQLHKKYGFSNFNLFHLAWQKTLNSNIETPKDVISKDSINLYLQEIGRIRLLKADEEIELARKIAKLLELEQIREELSCQLERVPHDTEWAIAAKMPLPEFHCCLQMGRKAKNKMVESNLRLVVSIAKKYQNRGLDLLDLIQEGNLGLIRAVEKFDYKKGNRFSTYAYWWIKQAITRAIADQSRLIRLPIHLNETISKIQKKTKSITQELGTTPKKQEIANRLEMTIEELEFILKCTLPIISLDTCVGEEDSTLGELIEFDGEIPENYIFKISDREYLESLLNILRPPQRYVLRLRYGLDDGREKTLQEIGNILNVTRERIRQIQAKALNKLRTWSGKIIITENFQNQNIKGENTQNGISSILKDKENQQSKKITAPIDKVGKELVSFATVALNETDRPLGTNYLPKQDEEDPILNEDLNRETSESNINNSKLPENEVKQVAKSMQYKLSDLIEQLALLEEDFTQHRAEILRAVQELEDPGIPISENLLAKLESSRRRFIDFGRKVIELAEYWAISPTPKLDEIVSLKDIKSLLDAIASAEKQKVALAQVREKALMVLKRVLAIAHQDNSDFEPLQECHQKAREIHLAISESQESNLHPEIQNLADGNHLFSHLLMLIERGDELDDDTCTSLQDSVEKLFNRRLSVAALRGKLIISNEGKINSQILPEVETAPILPIDEPKLEYNETSISEEIGQNQPEIKSEIKGFETASATPEDLTQSPISESQSDSLKFAETEGEVEAEYDLIALDAEEQNTGSVGEEIGGENPQIISDRIWQLLSENKLSLAFHLARCLEIKYPNFQPQLPSAIIRGVILGRHVRDEVGIGEIANILKDDFAKIVNNNLLDEKTEYKQAISLLLAAAALCPAFLAPNTNASEILNSIRLGGFNQLYEYCQIISKYGNQGLALDTTAIKTEEKNQATWEAEMAALQQKVKIWSYEAKLLYLHYETAKAVWMEWFKPNKLIHSLLFPVMQNDLSKLGDAKRDVERWSNEAQIKEEVKRTQREMGLFRGSGDAITGSTLNRICQKISEAVKFVSKWIKLQESRPDKSNSYSQKQSQQLQRDLANLHQAVLQELDLVVDENSSVLVKAGIACCRTAVEEIRNLFEPNEPLSTFEPKVKYLLNAELLKLPSVPMNSDWEPDEGSQNLLVKEVMNQVDDCNWRQAFEARSNKKDHEATERIIEYLRNYPQASINIDELEKQRNYQINNCRSELQELLNVTRRKLEGDVALGLLEETERLDYAAQIESIENAMMIIVRFGENIYQLQAITERLNLNRSKKIERYRQGILKKIGSDHPEYARICNVLDTGDFLTANEYIENRKTIPESEEKKKDALIDFLKKYGAIKDVLEPTDRNRPKRREIISDILKGRNIGPLQMQQLQGTPSKQASEMLETWFVAKNKKDTIGQEDIRSILNPLGFNTKQITINKSGNYTWIELTTELIQEKNRCPVPAYGSQANGHYRIFCVWDRLPEVTMLDAVGDTFGGSPVIVFHFGRMGEKIRRNLARLCRERRRTFIVIDDNLMFYLCGERDERLRVLFDCTLPFTFLEPYTTTASEFVPEMFYGRERERQSIIDPMGSCLIYGGRQLGKTVLLRYVHQNFNALNKEAVAGFLDIKEVGGRTQSPDDIWSLIVSKLEEMKILDPKRRNLPNPKTLQQIKIWLDVDIQRRILLLLDEADNFLEADGKEGFQRCDELRKLMLETNRRFKVVFAGLHNVQRTTRLENHPLAHFGEPICIGPLLNNGEMREARNLIKRPFASIGYRFESDDLITRILWQTNYYPSLIQLYCQQLLRHVTNPDTVNFDDKNSPPYVIISTQVDDAYNNQDLRKAIRDRFMLTLHLDERYAVIAYSIAWGTMDDEKGMVDGFSVSWIRQEALFWWYEGFRDLSLDEIQVLLEEMVGLGVLREANGGYFTLRSRNLLLLMGTQEEIQAALLKPRELPLVYEPATFRSALVGIKDDFRRSPLTAQQESQLQSNKNGVSIIFGCKAAGIDDLKIFLESIFSYKKQLFHYCNDILSQADLSQTLQSIIQNRQKDGTTVIFVPDSCPWNQHWIDETIQQIGKLRSKTSFVRVVFIADAQKAWQLINKNSTEFDWFKALSIGLKPWHNAALRQWLQDCNFPNDKVTCEKITEVTGNWPILLQRFYQISKSDIHRWESHLQNLKHLFHDYEEVRNLLLNLGIERQEQQRVLNALALFPNDNLSADDLVDLTDGLSAELINKVLRWADLLSLASPTGKREDSECWRINPVVASVLQSMKE